MNERCYTDRLVDFVRAHNHTLLDGFDSLRAAYLTGSDDDAAGRAGAWRDELARHLRWEENWLLDEYAARSRATDIPEIAVHVHEHERMIELADELADDLAHAADRNRVRSVIDTLDVMLLDHKEREENEVCAALDHVLDAPRREGIERALR